MRVIRRAMFETNSSSTHSITIDRKWPPSKMGKIHVEPDGVCYVYPGEFGWGVEEFRDAAAKASYCYTFATTVAAEEEGKALLDRLAKLIREQTGCSEVKFCVLRREGEENRGYIDHQSKDVAREAFENDETLRDFIFNPDSILRIDNDNH